MTYSVQQTEPVPDARQLLDTHVGSTDKRYLVADGLDQSSLRTGGRPRGRHSAEDPALSGFV